MYCGGAPIPASCAGDRFSIPGGALIGSLCRYRRRAK